MVYRICLLRHGESDWNRKNIFSGWTDVDLSESGRLQAMRAGNVLKAHGFHFDLAFTSVLKRAVRTLWLTLDEMDLMHVEDIKSWRLNERHYGALQGLNKAETAAQYGDKQVHIWRRSYDTRPPALSPDDPRHPKHDIRYRQRGSHDPADETGHLPDTESLKDCVARTLPFWHEVIVPAIRAGHRVIVAAHGNSLRGIVKLLDNISDQDIMGVEIPVGTPLIYDLDPVTLKPVRHFYLGEPQVIGDAGPQPLVGPSSWGLVTGVGPHLAAWLSDLKRVGLVRPLGIMQWAGASSAAGPCGGTGQQQQQEQAGAPAEAGGATQQQVAAAGGESVITQGYVSFTEQQEVVGPEAGRAASTTSGGLGSGGNSRPLPHMALAPVGEEERRGSPPAVVVGALEGATCIDDLAGVLQHSRFVALDICSMGPLQSLKPTLSQLAPLLDPLQHTLLIMCDECPACITHEAVGGMGYGPSSIDLLGECCGCLDPGVKILAVYLPPTTPTAETVALSAAASTDNTKLLSARPPTAAAEPAPADLEPTSFTRTAGAGLGPVPTGAGIAPGRVEGAPITNMATVVVLSAGAGEAVRMVELMLQYTGRAVTVIS